MKGVSYDSLFSVASIQERKDRSNDFCPAFVRPDKYGSIGLTDSYGIAPKKYRFGI